MPARTTTQGAASAPIAQDELRSLQQRSDARGLLRLAGHLAAIAASLALYALALQRSWPLPVVALLAVAYGFTLVTMFAAMHETVHRTAFKSLWLNNSVGWFAGLLSFYNSTFYRHYHGWHHRFTQIPGKDPELDDGKPTSLLSYAIELSGVPWWFGKLKTHATLALGRTAAYGFLNEDKGPQAVRSVRLQLGVYGAAVAASFALGSPYFALYWLLPVAVGQPILRAILLAEHTGCAESDDALANTRTTHTLWPVRFLMWEMPYHAEHHRYPALPFFTLAAAHQQLGPHLSHVARGGYLGMHRELLARLLERPRRLR
jgi:fatty acid desaturase